MKNYTRKSDNYAGKIEYYQAKLSMAVDALEIHNIKFYTTKLEYFVNRAVTCSAALDNSFANESI
jgi:hypothetical protein|tara:strand:+ start:653 stop:847 length:195 start_codon:yes stop_codon:yes gene_type:complete